MAFNITLQYTGMEPFRVQKEPEDIITLSGTLKNETSITDPEILIEADYDDIARANYMTIPSFNRSYFITNMYNVRTNLVRIIAHVDVLSSWTTEMLACKAIVKRAQENVWNLYLNDGSLKVYQNPHVLTKPFPTGFTTHDFVLAIAGS